MTTSHSPRKRATDDARCAHQSCWGASRFSWLVSSAGARVALGLACAVVPLVAGLGVFAQQGSVALDAPVITWSTPINLSRSPQSSDHPAVVADGYGHVHVFWAEDVGGSPLAPDDLPTPGNAITHCEWDGHRWSSAVDVLTVPFDTVASFPAVDLDRENRLHLVWLGQQAVYYSSAPAEAASSAHAWSDPVVVTAGTLLTPWAVSIAVDSAFTLHVILADNRFGGSVYALRSTDGGITWEPPIEIFRPSDSMEIGAAHVQLKVDHDDRLYATWQTQQEENYGQAVYFARSSDRGVSWENPIRLAYRNPGETFTEWLSLAIRQTGEIHAFYVDGWHTGRWHRISDDGGETWSEPQHFITDLQGINGFMAPVIDGAGRLHLVINMRTFEGQAVGIYIAHWLEDNWSAVRIVDTTSPAAPSAHRAAAALRLGNEIHVVYVQLRGAEIWHVSGEISNLAPQPTDQPPALALAPLPTAVVRPTHRPTVEPPQAVYLTSPTEQTSPGAHWGWGVGLLWVVVLVAGVTWHRIGSTRAR